MRRDDLEALVVLTWNVNCFTEERAERKAALLSMLEWDVALLQEVSEETYAVLRREVEGNAAAALDLVDEPSTGKAHGCAILTRPGIELVRPRLVEGAGGGEPERPFAERALAADVIVEGFRVVVCSWHAPHSFGKTDEERTPRLERKLRAYRALERWAAGERPLVIGMDANTWADPVVMRPAVPDDEQYEVERFHLADATHGLRDAWRRLLEQVPEELERLGRLRGADGQLAVTHVWGDRSHPEVNRRDRIYASNDFEPADVVHGYAEGLMAGSDHGYVMAQLAYSPDGRPIRVAVER